MYLKGNKVIKYGVWGKARVDKKPLIVVSICAVVLLVLGSLSNVVGYQTVQTTQQNVIKERINQREMLFQTILDMANNKEIQRIILKSQMNGGIFPTSDIPMLTKNQFKVMYFIGLLLSKVINTSRMQSILGQYRFNNQDIQKEITTIIEKDTTLKGGITQLQNFECDCENDNLTDYPIICGILFILFIVSAAILLPFKLIVDLFLGIFNGTLLESLVVFFGLILDTILFPIWLLLGITLYLSLFVFSCWNPGPISSNI
jgi:hypothetical protein